MACAELVGRLPSSFRLDPRRSTRVFTTSIPTSSLSSPQGSRSTSHCASMARPSIHRRVATAERVGRSARRRRDRRNLAWRFATQGHSGVRTGNADGRHRRSFRSSSEAGVRRPARRPYGAPEVVDGGSTSPGRTNMRWRDRVRVAVWWTGAAIGGVGARRSGAAGCKRRSVGQRTDDGSCARSCARFDNCGKFVEAMRAAVNGAATGPRSPSHARPKPDRRDTAARLSRASRHRAG